MKTWVQLGKRFTSKSAAESSRKMRSSWPTPSTKTSPFKNNSKKRLKRRRKYSTSMLNRKVTSLKSCESLLGSAVSSVSVTVYGASLFWQTQSVRMLQGWYSTAKRLFTKIRDRSSNSLKKRTDFFIVGRLQYRVSILVKSQFIKNSIKSCSLQRLQKMQVFLRKTPPLW